MACIYKKKKEKKEIVTWQLCAYLYLLEKCAYQDANIGFVFT